ncbi:hypothetical protein [Actinomadura sp. 3N407]|uniref:hypothetical protein n=1 Tax=Actinomadura sp. 3N407 TaxID=3457423 RepID=UPI003FCE3430
MIDSAAPGRGKTPGSRAAAHIADLRSRAHLVSNSVLAELAGVSPETIGTIARGQRDTIPTTTHNQILAITVDQAARAAGYVPAAAAAAHVRRLLLAGPPITRQRIGKSAKVGTAFVDALLDTSPAFIPAKHARRLETLLLRGEGADTRLTLPNPSTPRRRVPVKPSRDHLTRLLTQVFQTSRPMLARQLQSHEATITGILHSWEAVSADLEQRVLAITPEHLAAAMNYVDADAALTNLTELLDNGSEDAVTTATIAAAAGVKENLVIKLLHTRPDYIPIPLAAALAAVTIERARGRQARVPADTTIAHLRMLLDTVPGASKMIIDRAAGLAPSTTCSILTRQQAVTARTRGRVLALTADDLVAYIAGLAPAEPALNAVNRLHRRGWSTHDIARAADLNPRTLRSALTSHDTPTWLPKTLVDAVTDAAARIGDQPGPSTPISAAEPRRLARSLAAQQWSPERIGRLIDYPERAVRILMTSDTDTVELGLAAGIARLARCLEGAHLTPDQCATKHGWTRLAERFRRHAPGAGPIQGPDPQAAVWARGNGWHALAAFDDDQLAAEAVHAGAGEHSPDVEQRAAQILTVLRASLPRASALGLHPPTSHQVTDDTGVPAHSVGRIWRDARYHTRQTGGQYLDEGMPARITQIKEALAWYDSSPAPTAAEVVASLGIPQQGYPPAANSDRPARREHQHTVEPDPTARYATMPVRGPGVRPAA